MAHREIQSIEGPGGVQGNGNTTAAAPGGNGGGAASARLERGGNSAPQASEELALSDELREEQEAEEARKSEKERETAGQDAEEQLKELEKKIEETQKKLEEVLKRGDYDEALPLMQELNGLTRERDRLTGGGSSPEATPASLGVPSGGGGGGAASAAAAPGGGGYAPGGGGSYPGLQPVPNYTPGPSYPSSPAPQGSPGGAAGTIDGPIQPPSGKLVSPLDNYRVTSEFGPRWGSQHSGIDLAAPTGTPVKAVADGTVTRVANDPAGYGNWVEVRHEDGSTSRYAHMSAFGKIKEGQEIGAGTVVGAVGSTGRSTGPHLHFEWRKPDGVAVNPRQLMNFA